ncbi:MAG: cytochrome b N-terminal domain-containing protein [Anaerolineales bacterium]
MTPSLSNKQLIDSLTERNPSVDWKARLQPASRRLLGFFERISLAFEKPLNWLINDSRFNPLYHTGTITIFLLFVILLTGIYLTLFYPFGFDVSYQAVAKIEGNLVSRIIRALHRYASDAAVIFALLHGWRTFFQDRFRGPRWLAWVTGVGMAFIVWAIGITGYWLIWDDRAQLINQSFYDIATNFRSGQKFIVDYIFGQSAGTGWIFMLFIIVLHVGLSIGTAFFLWMHLKRMSRAKWLPPTYWMIISVAVLLLASALFPLGMLPAIDMTKLPGKTPIDLFYLFYLPTFLRGPQALFWSILLVVFGVSIALPWIMPRAKELKPVQVNLPQCDGCTLCERDCPYLAIKMIPRTDGAHHKYQAEIDPNLCVSCGVCIGSCPENALTFGDISLNSLWENTLTQIKQDPGAKVVFTCERHAIQNASELQKEQNIIVPFTCIAMANPKLAAQAIEAGASDVQFIGCPPEDCANREGNVWLQDRITGKRLPKLKPAFIPLVNSTWIAPTEFKKTINTKAETQSSAYTFTPDKSHIRFIIPLLGIMAVIFSLQIWLSDFPVNFFAPTSASIAIYFTHHSGYSVRDVASLVPPELDLEQPTHIKLTVDDKLVLDETYPVESHGVNQGTRIFEQVDIPSGKHHIILTMADRPDPSIEQVLFDQTITLQNKQIYSITFRDQHVSDPVAGEKLYYDTSADTNTGCRICHSLEKDERIIGPSFYGVATRAETRIPGMSAEEYIRQSILEPNAYVVPGFPEGQMLQNFGQTLTDEQIDDLVAFLLTMK